MDGCIFFRSHCASDLAGSACMGFFAWRSFHDRDGRHAQKLRSCVHKAYQGVQLICVPLGFVDDQTLTKTIGTSAVILNPSIMTDSWVGVCVCK